jgi:DNA-binding MarR family transcriptional regulator/GNAT superfamily N-acetyltransferase
MDLFNDAGLLIIGTRLKKLGDRFLNEISQVYKKQDIPFEPVWFPVFFLLHKKGSLSLTEIASQLEVSHSAISQMITQLVNKKMVEIQPDESDARIKKIIFSSKGQKLIDQILPVWEALQKSISQIIPAGIHPDDFMRILSEVESKLNGTFLSETTLTYLHDQAPDISMVITGESLMKKMVSWLKGEKVSYDYPSASFLMAMHGDEIMGILAFETRGEAIFLNNIYVTPCHRRKGIGLRMIRHIMENNSPSHFLLEEANLDLIKVLIKSGYSFKVG